MKSDHYNKQFGSEYSNLLDNVIMSLSKDDVKGESHFDKLSVTGVSSDVILSLSKDDGNKTSLPSKINWLMNFIIIIKIIFLINHPTNAQSLEWFPKELNVQPFTANFLEPKAGFLFNTSDNKIRLDISTSQDLLIITNHDFAYSFGADLFTFTRLRSEKDFHFPVETIDYLFGLNASLKKVINKDEYGLRFRFSHISAHLVDGQFDKSVNQWRDGRLPQVYSREFFELFPFIRINDLRFYIGLTYIFHSSPDEIKKGIFQIGGDFFITTLKTQFFTPYIAYDFKLSGKDKYVGNNFINFGLKFGEFSKKGFSVYYSYISGKSVHGEYFDLNENYSSIGFNLDL